MPVTAWSGALTLGTLECTISRNYNAYSLAPTTAHILWTKSEAFGGTIGGEFGGKAAKDSIGGESFYSTSAVRDEICPIIMNGILYYEQCPGSY